MSVMAIAVAMTGNRFCLPIVCSQQIGVGESDTPKKEQATLPPEGLRFGFGQPESFDCQILIEVEAKGCGLRRELF